MAIKHFVKWEHEIDFEEWTDEIENEMKKYVFMFMCAAIIC